MDIKPYLTLVKKDLLIEWRLKHTFYGVLLYVASTVYLIYMMAGQPESRIWNTLFWLTQLFIAVNTVAKSFLQEHPDRFRYYFTIVSPTVFFLSKMTYSILQMILISIISLILYIVLLGNPLINLGLFILIVFTGSLSLATLFTFLSAIAAKAQQNSALMAILGFPLITPVLMILSKLAVKALDPVLIEGWGTLVGVLVAINILIILLGVILFSYLWQE